MEAKDAREAGIARGRGKARGTKPRARSDGQGTRGEARGAGENIGAPSTLG